MFKWVHLSDIHFQTKLEGFNSKRLKEKLPNYLSAIEDVSALIITGDYRFAPETETNPKKVAIYITSLAESLGIDSTQIYIVPGNHDLTRDTVRTAVLKDEKSEYSPSNGIFDVGRRNALLKGFDFFRQLEIFLFEQNYLADCEKVHFIKELPECNLLLLNTAILAGTNTDEHELLLGTGYIEGVLSEISNSKPVIAIGHHGKNFLDIEEYRACSKLFEDRNVKLYLCGHEHKLWTEPFADTGKQITVGCLMQDKGTVQAGISVGELKDDGTVVVKNHYWDQEFQKWSDHTASSDIYVKLFDIQKPEYKDDEVIEKSSHDFSIEGLFLLGGRGIDGVKYYWKKGSDYVESLAFNRRLKDITDEPEDVKISAYTTSVSFGCLLSTNAMQCRFCETGARDFRGYLRAEDMALQNIFMAEYDSDCPSFPHVKLNKREFAYMGQGELGFNYPAVRRSIQLTDYAMQRIGQVVHRYILSTCGICDFIPSLINDISNNVFKNTVTLHFSLHAIGEDRDYLMPINRDYNYKDFLNQCHSLYKVTGEKIGVGILMFKNFLPNESFRLSEKKYTLTQHKLDKILDQLDSEVFRIDLCDLNKTSVFEKKVSFRNEDAIKLLERTKERGFECKCFSSFGDDEATRSGCGMLQSNQDNVDDIGNTTISHFNSSLKLLKEALVEIDSF